MNRRRRTLKTILWKENNILLCCNFFNGNKSILDEKYCGELSIERHQLFIRKSCESNLKVAEKCYYFAFVFISFTIFKCTNNFGEI